VRTASSIRLSWGQLVRPSQPQCNELPAPASKPGRAALLSPEASLIGNPAALRASPVWGTSSPDHLPDFRALRQHSGLCSIADERVNHAPPQNAAAQRRITSSPKCIQTHARKNPPNSITITSPASAQPIPTYPLSIGFVPTPASMWTPQSRWSRIVPTTHLPCRIAVSDALILAARAPLGRLTAGALHRKDRESNRETS